MMNVDEIKTILELLRPQQPSSDPLARVMEAIIMRDLIKTFKEEEKTRKSMIDFGDILEFYKAMKMLKYLEKMLGEEEKGEMKELLAQLESKFKEDQLSKVLDKLAEKDRQVLTLLKELQEKSSKKEEEYAKRLEELINELQQRYTEDQLRMFQQFDKVVAELKSKGEFGKLKEFVNQFSEFTQLVDEINRVAEKLHLRKEPLVQEGGKINWDKVFDFLTEIVKKGFTSPPPKREIPESLPTTPIETSQITTTQPSLPQIPTEQPKIESSITPPKIEVVETPKVEIPPPPEIPPPAPKEIPKLPLKKPE